MYAQGQQLARILRDTRKEERGANKARNIQVTHHILHEGATDRRTCRCSVCNVLLQID